MKQQTKSINNTNELIVTRNFMGYVDNNGGSNTANFIYNFDLNLFNNSPKRVKINYLYITNNQTDQNNQKEMWILNFKNDLNIIPTIYQTQTPSPYIFNIEASFSNQHINNNQSLNIQVLNTATAGEDQLFRDMNITFSLSFYY